MKGYGAAYEPSYTLLPQIDQLIPENHDTENSVMQSIEEVAIKACDPEKELGHRIGAVIEEGIVDPLRYPSRNKNSPLRFIINEFLRSRSDDKPVRRML